MLHGRGQEGDCIIAEYLSARSIFDAIDRDFSANIEVIAIDPSKEVLSAVANKPGATAHHVAGQGGPSTNYAVQPPNQGAPAAPAAQEISSELQAQPRDPAMAPAQGETRHNPGKLYFLLCTSSLSLKADCHALSQPSTLR